MKHNPHSEPIIAKSEGSACVLVLGVGHVAVDSYSQVAGMPFADRLSSETPA